MSTSTSSDFVLLFHLSRCFSAFSAFFAVSLFAQRFLFWLPLFITRVCVCVRERDCHCTLLLAAILAVVVCRPKMRLNSKVATWDEFFFPVLFHSLSLFLCQFLGAVRTGAFIRRLSWQLTHTHTRTLEAPFCCQLCVLSALRRFRLVLALALAIYSAVCCDFVAFCYCRWQLAWSGVTGHGSVCLRSHFTVLTSQLIDRFPIVFHAPLPHTRLRADFN